MQRPRIVIDRITWSSSSRGRSRVKESLQTNSAATYGDFRNYFLNNRGRASERYLAYVISFNLTSLYAFYALSLLLRCCRWSISWAIRSIMCVCEGMMINFKGINIIFKRYVRKNTQNLTKLTILSLINCLMNFTSIFV